MFVCFGVDWLVGFLNNHMKGEDFKSRFPKIGLFRARAPVCEGSEQCPQLHLGLRMGMDGSWWIHSVVPLMPLLGEEGPAQCEQLSLAVTLGGTV